MISACGATDFEADESRTISIIEKEKEKPTKNKNVEKIELVQSSGQTLGISIKGGVDHPFLLSKDDKVADAGIFVIHIYAGGVASLDGRLRLGDRILAVNGENVQNVKQKDFLKTLVKASKTTEKLELTVKHNEALKKRLSSRQTALPKPSVNSEAASSSNSCQLNGVQMLTGCFGGHFEPLEVCANPNFLTKLEGTNEKELQLGAPPTKKLAPSSGVQNPTESSVSPQISVEKQKIKVKSTEEKSGFEEPQETGRLFARRTMLLPATAAVVVVLAALLYHRRRA